jgi:hypothetical protein
MTREYVLKRILSLLAIGNLVFHYSLVLNFDGDTLKSQGLLH